MQFSENAAHDDGLVDQVGRRELIDAVGDGEHVDVRNAREFERVGECCRVRPGCPVRGREAVRRDVERRGENRRDGAHAVGVERQHRVVLADVRHIAGPLHEAVAVRGRCRDGDDRIRVERIRFRRGRHGDRAAGPRRRRDLDRLRQRRTGKDERQA